MAAFVRNGGLPFPHIFTHVHEASNISLWSNEFLLLRSLLVLLFNTSLNLRQMTPFARADFDYFIIFDRILDI